MIAIGILTMTGFTIQTQTAPVQAESSSQAEAAYHTFYYNHIVTPNDPFLSVDVEIICGSTINGIYSVYGTSEIPFSPITNEMVCSVQIVGVPVGYVIISGGGKIQHTIGDTNFRFKHYITFH